MTAGTSGVGFLNNGNGMDAAGSKLTKIQRRILVLLSDLLSAMHTGQLLNYMNISLVILAFGYILELRTRNMG